MDPENIMRTKYNDGSYHIFHMYLDGKGFYGNKDSYNYFDKDVDKIIVYKKNILSDIMM